MTMLPAHDSRSLRRCEHGDVRRVEFADPRSRRYAMVLAADAVISIGGGIGTDSILELAWIAEKVMIPIRSSGGASAECWEKYGSHLKRRLRIRDDELNAIEADTSTLDDITNACLSILERHLRPRCFVAMAFGDKHPVSSAWEMYEAVLADRGFNPTRIDKQAVLGSVIQAISPDG